MSLKKFSIEGMHCKSCKLLVEDIMEDLEVEVKSLNVDEDSQVGIMEVDSDTDGEKIIEAIKSESDYKIKEI